MDIKLSPQRRDSTLSVVKKGDILTINGEDFDFSFVTEGSILPQAAITSDWFGGDVTRTGGSLKITLINPHGPNPSNAAAFPVPLTNVADGPVVLPQ